MWFAEFREQANEITALSKMLIPTFNILLMAIHCSQYDIKNITTHKKTISYTLMTLYRICKLLYLLKNTGGKNYFALELLFSKCSNLR